MNEENIVGLSDIDKSLELDRYVPDLIDEEKEYYLKKYLNVDYFVFFDEFIKEQRVKNQMFIKDPISLLNEDEDFLKLWEKRDNLVQLVPEYFTNNNIKNFLTNHSTSVMFKQWSWCWGSVKILPMFFKENDIAFSPEWVYYKNYFIFLHPILFQLDLFWVDFLETYWKLHKNWVVFKICLDLNTMVSLDHYRRIELEKGILYWKPYSDDNLFEWNKEAYFTKLIRDEKVEKYQGNNITSTEFLIDQKNGSFEIEEIIAKDWIYINRYIHTLFDINTKNIIHFDGSLLTYNKDSYNNRKCIIWNSY